MRKRILSLALVLAVLCGLLALPVSARAADYTAQADTLNALGLFLGSDKGYELDRSMTRAEAAVMVTRLLGKEAKALADKPAHPFTDVPDWASGQVGYLYQNGLTKGVSDTSYDANRDITPDQYATFMLRVLGYDDSAGDFVWDKALAKMGALGVISQNDVTAFGKNQSLLRDTAVAISRAALLAPYKGSYFSLIHRLYIKDKAVPAAKLSAAAKKDTAFAQQAALVGLPGAVGERALDSEALFQTDSPAVVYMEVYGRDGTLESSGSGFFLTESGVLATNYHVIEYAYSVKVITDDEKVYEVDKLIAGSPDEDIALLTVKGQGPFPYLKLGDPAALRAAQRIYCIGSPLGFHNTPSEGLFSRWHNYEGQDLLQFSAPISPGSSGGALLNEYGQAVGLTTYTTEGQNLNFAIPVTSIGKIDYYDTPVDLRTLAERAYWDLVWDVAEWWCDYDEEQEENDAKANQTIEVDTIYEATLSDGDDVDLYAIPTQTALEFFLLWRAEDTAVREHIRVEVVDTETGAVLIRSRPVTQTPYLYLEGRIKAGSHCALRVSADGAAGYAWGKDTPYAFASMYTEIYPSPSEPYENISTEREPNDSFELAQYLPYGLTEEGSLSSGTDK
ncbi:MAG: trypsin-like peptidase domain-containing protein, partial [Oscillospiraceae bacterium]|nr:trypsin-like peptidase domain-containing protein [Oscillospiraceae bacterium]